MEIDEIPAELMEEIRRELPLAHFDNYGEIDANTVSRKPSTVTIEPLKGFIVYRDLPKVIDLINPKHLSKFRLASPRSHEWVKTYVIRVNLEDCGIRQVITLGPILREIAD